MSQTEMDGLSLPVAEVKKAVLQPEKSNSSPTTTNRNEITEEFAIASILMIAYLTETVVQAFLIFDCYRSSYFLVTTNWLWILLASWLLTSILVTIISMVWTQQGMDFSGRACGQLLCYLMHCFLLGLLWRYLKIALAYDKADVVEFFKLRTLQIYVQVLPLIIIHLVFFISPAQGVESMTSWMIVGEIFSASISLVLYSLSKPKLDFICENISKEHNEVDGDVVDDDERPLTIQANVTSRILLLISRVLSLALFVSSTSYWSLVALLSHLVLCQTWIFVLNSVLTLRRSNGKWSSDCDNEKKCLGESSISSSSHTMNEISPSSCKLKTGSAKMPMMRMVMCAYVLFWDVNSTILNDINLLSLSLPILLVLVENVTIVVYHLNYEHGSATTILLTLASGSCLGVGWILLLMVTTWNKWLILQPCQQRQSAETYLQSSRDEMIKKGCPVVDLYSDLNMNEKPASPTSGRNRKTMLSGMRTMKDTRVAEISLIPRVINECSFHDKLGLGRSHKSGNNTESLEGNNSSTTIRAILVSNDYERINETLMTTANKLGLCNKTSNQSEVVKYDSIILTPNTLCGGETALQAVKMHNEEKYVRSSENTLGSNSSRNTNTISGFETDDQVMELRCTKLSDHRTQVQPIPNVAYETSQKSIFEIRTASKIILNNNSNAKQYGIQEPTTERRGSNRCCCTAEHEELQQQVQAHQEKCGRESDNNIYEKLIEDAYGILIYEGDPTQRTERCIKPDRPHSNSLFSSRKKLKVLCAKCLENHDPLLTDCLENSDGTTNTNHLPKPKLELMKSHPCSHQQPHERLSVPFGPTTTTAGLQSPRVPPSETTEYPTDTEFTYNNVPEGDELSISTHLSTIHSATYANLPIKCYFSHLLAPIHNTSKNPKEFTGTEYVKAWLMMSNNCTNFSESEFAHESRENTCTKTNAFSKLNKSYHNEKLIIKSRNSSHNHNHEKCRRSSIDRSIKDKPVFSTSTYQPPPKIKQHPVSMFHRSNRDTMPHYWHNLNNNNHQHHYQGKVITFSKINDSSHLPRNCKLIDLSLHNDLLETIV